MPFDPSCPVSALPAEPLASAAVGSRVRITGLSAATGWERRLTELGLPRGAEITVVGRMGKKGAVVVAAHGTRLVVGAEMAAAILVSSLS